LNILKRKPISGQRIARLADCCFSWLTAGIYFSGHLPQIAKPIEKLSQLEYVTMLAGKALHRAGTRMDKMISTLLKLGFWGGLTLLIIPVDFGAERAGRTVSAFEAVIAAKATVDDLREICVRKPDVCETGGAALQTITSRAKAGAKLVLQYVEDEPEDIKQPLPPKNIKS
jgi:Family of unknown function (DUF5330)